MLESERQNSIKYQATITIILFEELHFCHFYKTPAKKY